MTRPTGFGAQCEHGRLARKCERCDDARELAALRIANEMRLATIADLRDRLRVMAGEAGGACDDCGCAARYYNKRCFDCHYVNWRACYESGEPERVVGACISAGIRALCGRRLLDGGEVK